MTKIKVLLGPRRSPAAGVLRRPRPSALHVRHSYPNALRASPREPCIVTFFNSTMRCELMRTALLCTIALEIKLALCKPVPVS